MTYSFCRRLDRQRPARSLRAASRLALPALVMLALFCRSGLAAEAAGISSCVPAVPCADPRGCPDLVVNGDLFDRFGLPIETQRFSQRSCSVLEGSTQPGIRRLLRFTSNTPNLGPGDLVIGDPAEHPEWFDFSPCHRHHHFKQYADYRLWTPAGYDAWQALRKRSRDACSADLLAANPDIAAQMVAGHKQGFCVIDVELSQIACPFPADAPKYDFCESFGRTPGSQGLSVCWADEYDAFLDGQWIDITGLPPGEYVLEDEVNAERFFEETDYSNNSSAVRVIIP